MAQQPEQAPVSETSVYTSPQGIGIHKLLRDATRYGASDLLLTAGAPPVIRLNGNLQAFDMPKLTGSDTHALLYGVLSEAQQAKFAANKEIDFALSIRGLLNPDEQDETRFRVNGFYQRGHVAAAFRLVPMVIPEPSALGIPPAVLQLANLRQGLVLVTGPTGHGKSTTLAALIELINRSRACHIITVEDPIEFMHEHKMSLIEQREVGQDTISFQEALKYVLRQNPDVILIGEMRDAETVAAAITAAETGHLVLATLHTNDVAQSVDRIIDIFPSDHQNQIRTQLAACLEAVISQRLIPMANGKGRVAAFEILIGTVGIRAMIRENRTHLIHAAMESGAKDGMVTMDRALKDLYEKGLIARDSYLNMLSNREREFVQR
jgi:twitching motility protein PilT